MLETRTRRTFLNVLRPFERVSILLGHQSVRITEKDYAPWVRARQERLGPMEVHGGCTGDSAHVIPSAGPSISWHMRDCSVFLFLFKLLSGLEI